MYTIMKFCAQTSGMHAGWIVIHGWGATLYHTRVHVRHHHPPRVKVHGQRWRASHGARWVKSRLFRAWLWCGTWSRSLLRCLGLELGLGNLAVLLLLLPLLLLFQELFLCAINSITVSPPCPNPPNIIT